MTQDPTEIEVEVLEIDGVAPAVSRARADEPPPTQGDWQDWRRWQGRARKIDARWWPLWVIPGILGLALLLTVGLVLGAVVLLVRLILKIIRAVLP